jgi:hypothetical protein
VIFFCSSFRTRSGSLDNGAGESFDVEKLKQELICEVRKEMTKLKTEILEGLFLTS